MTNICNIFSNRHEYKPFVYDWAYEIWDTHEKAHWLPNEIPLLEDVKDWNTKLNDEDKFLLSNIFKLFTQMDIDVGTGYLNYYAPVFKLPELRMMLSGFAAREAIHIAAYSLLIETIGFKDTQYSEFKSIPEMMDKHNHLYGVDTSLIKNFKPDNEENVNELLKAILLLSIFGEGVSLFGTFCVLMNYQRQGLMQGMTTVVDWSIRDENMHVEGLTNIFNTIVKEFHGSMPSEIKNLAVDISESTLELEFKFIDTVFNNSGKAIRNLTTGQVKDFVAYMSKVRLNSIGIRRKVNDNPLPWMNYFVEGASHVNFFERTSTDYSKGSINWDYENLRF